MGSWVHHRARRYFKVATEIVKKYGGLFICDECRRLRAHRRQDVGHRAPRRRRAGHHDHGEGIANGFPIAATIATAPIADSGRGETSPPSAATRSARPRPTRRSTRSSIRTDGERRRDGKSSARGSRAPEEVPARHRRRPRRADAAIELVKDETANDRTPPPRPRRASSRRPASAASSSGAAAPQQLMRIAAALNCGKSDVDEAMKIMEQSVRRAERLTHDHKYPLPEERLETRLQDKKPLYSEAEARAEAERCLYCVTRRARRRPDGDRRPDVHQKIASGNVRGARRRSSSRTSSASRAPACAPGGALRGRVRLQRWHRRRSRSALAAVRDRDGDRDGQRPLLQPKGAGREGEASRVHRRGARRSRARRTSRSRGTRRRLSARSAPRWAQHDRDRAVQASTPTTRSTRSSGCRSSASRSHGDRGRKRRHGEVARRRVRRRLPRARPRRRLDAGHPRRERTGVVVRRRGSRR